ncbi:hypothetical protein [Polaromonas sp. P5_D5]
MKRWWHSPYFSLIGNVAGLCLGLILGWVCLNAMLAGEIKFSKANRWIRLESEPTVFWLAFWFQFALAVFVVAVTPRSIRKDIRAIRENRAQSKNS